MQFCKEEALGLSRACPGFRGIAGILTEGSKDAAPRRCAAPLPVCTGIEKTDGQMCQAVTVVVSECRNTGEFQCFCLFHILDIVFYKPVLLLK